MKYFPLFSLKKSLLLTAITFISYVSFAQDNSVTIGGETTRDDAVLWLIPSGNGGKQGLMLPVVVNVNDFTPNSGAQGMVVYDNATGRVHYYNGAQWIAFVAGGTEDADYGLQYANGIVSLVEGGTNSEVNIALNGDVSAIDGITSVEALQGNPLKNESLNGTTDVGKLLEWNGTNWAAATVTSNGAANSMNDLDDVNASGVSNGQVLIFDNGVWSFSDLNLFSGNFNDLTDVPTFGVSGNFGLVPDPGATSGQYLKDDGTWETPAATALPNTGIGEILIGNGTDVNAFTTSGDVVIAIDGTISIETSAGNNINAIINNSSTTTTINVNRLNSSVILESESPAAGGNISGSFTTGLTIDVGAVSGGVDGIIADASITNDDIADDTIDPGKISPTAASPGIMVTNGTNTADWLTEANPNRLLGTDGTGNLAWVPATVGDFTVDVRNNYLAGTAGGALTEVARNNVLIGDNAGSAIINGANNVIIGDNAGASNEGGEQRNVIIGANANAAGSAGTAIGHNANSSGTNTVALGNNAGTGGGVGSMALGVDSNTIGARSIALGYQAGTIADNAIAIGSGTIATQTNTVILGDGTNSNFDIGIGTATPHTSALMDLNANNKGLLIPRMTTAERNGIGTPGNGLMIYNTTNSEFNYYNITAWVPIGGGVGDFTVDAGNNYTAGTAGGSLDPTNALNNVLIGNNAGASITTGDNNVVIGRDAGANIPVTGANNVVIGAIADAGSFGTAVGHNASGRGTNTVALGNGATTNGGSGSMALGATSFADGGGSIALGFQAGATADNAVAIGTNALASASNAIAIGANTDATQPNTIILGDGISPSNYDIGIGTPTPESSLHITSNTPGLKIGHTSASTNEWEFKVDPTGLFALSNEGGGTPFTSFWIHPNRGSITISNNPYPNNNPPSSLLVVNDNAPEKIGSGPWAGFSDERIKKDIKSYNKGLDELLKINTVSFRYNKTLGYTDTTSMHIGVIAQEIQKVLPSTITETKRQIDSSGLGLLKYNPNELTYLTINAIKELDKMIASQAMEIEKLQAEVIKLQTLAKRPSPAPAVSELTLLKAELAEIKALLGVEVKKTIEKE